MILPSGSPLIKLENSFVPLWLGWTLLVLFVVGYAAVKVNDALGRRRAGLSRAPFTVIAAKVVALAAIGAAFTYEMGVNRNLSTNAFLSNKAQGMPWVVVLLVILYTMWHFVLSRTRYAQHVYAVGGNEEASRRAGVVVSRIRISVFVICSGMAAVSGMIAASLLQSVLRTHRLTLLGLLRGRRTMDSFLRLAGLGEQVLKGAQDRLDLPPHPGEGSCDLAMLVQQIDLGLVPVDRRRAIVHAKVEPLPDLLESRGDPEEPRILAKLHAAVAAVQPESMRQIKLGVVGNGGDLQGTRQSSFLEGSLQRSKLRDGQRALVGVVAPRVEERDD